jgi:hypothetical protein
MADHDYEIIGWPPMSDPVPEAVVQAAKDLHPAQTTIKIPSDVAVRLREAANDRGVGVGYLAVRLVKEGLERLVPLAELKLTKDGG